MPDGSNALLQGTVVLVTGAGRGLGHGVARGLADYGASVLGVARSDTELSELATTAPDHENCPVGAFTHGAPLSAAKGEELQGLHGSLSFAASAANWATDAR